MTAPTPSLQGHVGFRNTLQLVQPHSLEDTVQSLWQEIVNEWFPGRHGYKWGYKAPTLANDNMPDITVIQVMIVTANPSLETGWEERQILLIECKRPSRDTPLGWGDTINSQFKDDLAQTLNASERLYGAVAIGKKVRFYRFDGRAAPDQELVQLHPGTIDMDIEGSITQVENMMNYIKATGWEWARPVAGS